MPNHQAAQQHINDTSNAWSRLQDLLELSMPHKTAVVVNQSYYLSGKVQLWPR